MNKLLPFIFLLVLITGCGNFVSVKVMRPAEISTAQYKKTAIGNIFANNSRSNDIQTFRTTLLAALQKKNYFEIIDTRMGMPSGNDVLIINANITNSDYNEEVTRGEPYKDKEGKSHVDQRREGTHVLNTSYQLNTINGVVVGIKSTVNESSTSTTATDKVPDGINREQLVLESITASVNEFLRAIIPYEERVSVEFMDDKSMPELKKGIEAAENGFWDLAITHFSKATAQTKNPLVHYAYYNEGVAYMYSYDFPKARISLRKALELKGSESVYKRAYQELDRMERDEIKLKEQRK